MCGVETDGATALRVRSAQLLSFLTKQLEVEAEKAKVLLSHSKGGEGLLASQSRFVVAGPVETAARLALSIVQLHFR